MSQVVEQAVAVMRKELGLAPLPEPVGSRHAFETEHCEVVIVPSPSERDAHIVARLGWLATDVRKAADEMKQVLHLGLALAPLNAAALGMMPEFAEANTETYGEWRDRMIDVALGQGAAVCLGVFASCGPAGTGAARALEDVCQWADLTAGILARSTQDAVGSVPDAIVPTPDMMIIRP